jgi:hypothetical protein
MEIFKTHKTFNEILPAFLAEKEIELKQKTYMSYAGKTKVFTQWLKNNSLSNVALRKLTNQNISEFFLFLVKEKSLDRPTCQKY